MLKNIFRGNSKFICAACLLFAITLLLQISLTAPARLQLSPAEKLRYLPPAPFLKALSLSYDSMLADILWINTIACVGEQTVSGQDYSWIYQMVDTITSLDPYYEYPYEFGGIILSGMVGDIEKSIIILKKGMKNVSRRHWRYWYLPFYTAFNYMYYKGDYKTAAHYLEEAASFPGSPTYLPLLTARLYANTDDPATAIPFLQEMLKTVSTKENKKKIQQRINAILVKIHLKKLSAAVMKYHEQRGIWPDKLTELLTTGILEKLPKEPFGGRYYISGTDHRVMSTSDVDPLRMKGDIDAKNQPFMLKYK